jgi:hypothetical protein
VELQLTEGGVKPVFSGTVLDLGMQKIDMKIPLLLLIAATTMMVSCGSNSYPTSTTYPDSRQYPYPGDQYPNQRYPSQSGRNDDLIVTRDGRVIDRNGRVVGTARNMPSSQSRVYGSRSTRPNDRDYRRRDDRYDNRRRDNDRYEKERDYKKYERDGRYRDNK